MIIPIEMINIVDIIVCIPKCIGRYLAEKVTKAEDKLKIIY
ncbi:MAG: hypothetical protein Q8900_05470 [Bacillota bacterium]|nr:hypothetical protein [Bacillota bacterium]